MQFIRVQAQHGFADMTEQLRGSAGAAHAVPLIAQATRGEAEGMAGIAGLGHGLPGQGAEACAAVRSGKLAVFVEASKACGATLF